MSEPATEYILTAGASVTAKSTQLPGSVSKKLLLRQRCKTAHLEIVGTAVVNDFLEIDRVLT